MAACRARRASARLPAMLSGLLASLLPEYPLSRAAGAGAGFLPTGRFAGGTGGVGFPRVPLAIPGAAGTGRDTGGGRGGAWTAISST